MRLFTVLCLSLAVVGLASGCTMMRNPLSARTEPQDTARQRMIAEMKARTERGDLKGAKRLLDEIEAREQSATESDSDVIQLASHNGAASRSEMDRLVDQLVAFDPPASREKNRQIYSQLSPAQIQQLLRNYEQVQQIGQHELNQNAFAGHSPQTLLAGQPSTGQSAPGNSIAAASGRTTPLSAPDPRPVGSGTLGAQSPWGTAGPSQGTGQTIAQGQGASASPGGGAPRLPDAALHNGAVGPGSGLQTVSGVQPQQGIAGSPPGNPNPNPFQRAHEQATHTSTVIPAGNAQPGHEQSIMIIQPKGEAPVEQSIIQSGATSYQASRVASGPGGVSLLNQIMPADGQGSGIGTLDTTGAGAATAAFGAGNTLQTGIATGAPATADAGVGAEALPTQPDAGSPGLPGMLGTGVRKLKDAASPLLSFGQNSPQEPSPIHSATAQSADVASLIQLLQADLLAAAPGQSDAEKLEFVRKHVRVRLLHLLDGNIGQAVEPIPGIDSTDQEFWQQMMWAMANYFDEQGRPESNVRATETIEQLRGAVAQLGQSADLKLRNTSFCHRIVSFGSYERFKEDRFKTGQPVLLYSEIENFHSTRSDADGYRTTLQSTIEIYNSSDMSRPVESIPFDPTDDFCRVRRRDYFHSYEFSIPPQLTPDDYTLVLRVVDQQSRKVATSRVNFVVE